MLNLITDPWLPVRRLSGAKPNVRPCDIASAFDADPILALDFPRPDWNAAVTELLIGLLATVTAPDGTKAWTDTWAKPPSPEDLERRLAPLAFAFNLGGDGPRCFQDLDPLDACEEKPITGLLIDAPGENAEKKNTDLFVKRAGATGLSLAHAAAALVTMQTYAPAGGQGNRTSMRGGGPLTTLPMPRRILDLPPGRKSVVTTLWDLVWSSVPDRPRIGQIPSARNDPAWALIFPWLVATRTSEGDRAVTLDDAHLLQQFFGLPRRLRLEVPTENDAAGYAVFAFRQKNFGVKYVGWVHSLSPHYADKKSGLLPFHPQPGGVTYHDWLTWVEVPEKKEKTSQRAACLDAWGDRLDDIKRRFGDGGAFDDIDPWQSSVLACGYDMDNMKARGWLEARIPYFDPPLGADPNAWPQRFRTRATNLVAGADSAASQLRIAIKVALTGKLNRDGRYMADENLPRDAFSDVVERLWRETEKEFREALAKLRGTDKAPGDPVDADMSVRGDFLKALRRKALNLFDEIVGVDLMDKEARRIVEARTRLLRAFNETGSVPGALGIVTEEASRRKTRANRNGRMRPNDQASGRLHNAERNLHKVVAGASSARWKRRSNP